MKYLARISEQAVFLETDGDPDSFCLRLNCLNYQAVQIPSWKHGQPLFEKEAGDLVTFIAPTLNGKRALVAYPGQGCGIYSEFDWDQLEPAKEGTLA